MCKRWCESAVCEHSNCDCMTAVHGNSCRGGGGDLGYILQVQHMQDAISGVPPRVVCAYGRWLRCGRCVCSESSDDVLM